jgi:hypothetical protein
VSRVAEFPGDLPAFHFHDLRLGVADLVAPLVVLEREPFAVPRQSGKGQPMGRARHELVVVGEPDRCADGTNDRRRVPQEVLEAQGQKTLGRRTVFERVPRRVAPVLRDEA